MILTHVDLIIRLFVILFGITFFLSISHVAVFPFFYCSNSLEYPTQTK